MAPGPHYLPVLMLRFQGLCTLHFPDESPFPLTRSALSPFIFAQTDTCLLGRVTLRQSARGSLCACTLHLNDETPLDTHVLLCSQLSLRGNTCVIHGEVSLLRGTQGWIQNAERK